MNLLPSSSGYQMQAAGSFETKVHVVMSQKTVISAVTAVGITNATRWDMVTVYLRLDK
jgi:molybdenum cofactor biosynthesis enzyme